MLMKKITNSRVAFFVPVLVLMLLMIASGEGWAQYYTLGSDPGKAEWMQLKGEHHTIIYPKENDSLARRYLYLFEKSRNQNDAGLLIKSDKLPIVLHPYNVESNGMVAWAPKRVDLFTSPPAYNGFSNNWEELLAYHEGRHVPQMTHYTKGIFGVLKFIFGEQAVAVGTGFYPSGWNLEGDAVINETDFTRAGRGRSSEFLMYFRSAFDQGDVRTYDHWRYGSYGKFSPNKYALGYLMMGYMRYSSDKYDFFGETMNSFKTDWWRVFSVWNTSFEKATGYTPRRNFWRMIPFYQDLWQKESLARGEFTKLTHHTDIAGKLYTEYHNPIPFGEEILATKNGFEHTNSLISIDKQANEKEIIPLSSNISTIVRDPGTSTLYWSEMVPDIRWELQSYSIIRSYDLESKKSKDITHKTKFFNPKISEKGLIVEEYPSEGGSNVVFLDKESGEVTLKKRAPKNGQATESILVGEKLYTVCITTEGMGIFSINLDEKESEWKEEIEPQAFIIKSLSNIDSALCFVSDFDGISNVFYYDPSIKLLRRLTNARYGAFDPIYEKDTLYFSDFEYMGHRPVTVATNSLDWSLADIKKPFKYQVAEHLALQARQNTSPLSQEEDDALKERIDQTESKSYNKLSHLFRFHSWMPLYANVNRIMDLSYDHYYQLASLGATIISQNSLGNATTMLGYSYHNGFHSGHINFNYSGFFPVFELAVDFNDRHRLTTTIEKDPNSVGRYPVKYQIDTTNTPSLDGSLKMYFPLNFSKGGWNTGLIPEVQLTMSNDTYSIYGSKFWPKTNLSYGVRYYRMLPTTKSSLFPRWGFGVQVSGAFAHGPHNENNNLAYFYAYGYLPGITRQHGIKLSVAHQKQFSNEGFGFLPNVASAPRGYDKYIMMDFTKATFDYAIPIYLNDVTWPWLYYLMRLQLVPFIDIAYDWSPNFPEKGNIVPTQNRFLYSYGTEALLKFHIFRIGAEIGFGVRYARTADDRNSIQVIFNTPL